MLSRHDMSPNNIEAQVKKEWKHMKFNEALRARDDRKALQAMEEINRSVPFDRSMPSGTAPSGYASRSVPSSNASAAAPSGNAGDDACAEPHADAIRRTATAPSSADLSGSKRKAQVTNQPEKVLRRTRPHW